jgi:hypothetical protein
MSQLTPLGPRVDVVVVNWNVREDLLACLRSLQESTHVDLRIVVVDNASADGSADAVGAEFSHITLVRNEDNTGFAYAANQGIAVGHSPLVLLLNPDTIVPSGAIATLAQRLEQLPSHALVAPRLLDASGAVMHSAYPFPSLWLSLLLATGLHRLVPVTIRARWLLEGSWQSNVDRDVPWVIGAVMLVRRSAIDAVGALDERFFVYGEDLEWCDRLCGAGYRIRFVPSVNIIHKGNRSGGQRYGDDRTAAYLRNTILFVRQRRGRVWALAYVALNGTATTVRFAVTALLMRVHPTEKRRGWYQLWRGHVRFYWRRTGVGGGKGDRRPLQP